MTRRRAGSGEPRGAPTVPFGGQTPGLVAAAQHDGGDVSAEIASPDKTLRIHDDEDAGGAIHRGDDYRARNVPFMLDWLEQRL